MGLRDRRPAPRSDTMAARRQRWVIDSIEESVASIEIDGKRTIQFPVASLPSGAAPGDVLAVTHDDAGRGDESPLSIVVDREATRAAKERSARQVADTGRSPGDPGGDIQL